MRELLAVEQLGVDVGIDTLPCVTPVLSILTRFEQQNMQAVSMQQTSVC